MKTNISQCSRKVAKSFASFSECVNVTRHSLDAWEFYRNRANARSLR